MSAVRCVDLCRTYRQGDEDIKALDHLSIDIDKGEFVCLMSPSGGGKTTLLNAIGGLDIPDSGEVWVGGQRIDQMSKGELADLQSAPHWYLGFSGGVDSTVLLHLLNRWRRANPGAPPLTAIHINHRPGQVLNTG